MANCVNNDLTDWGTAYSHFSKRITHILAKNKELNGTKPTLFLFELGVMCDSHKESHDLQVKTKTVCVFSRKIAK